MTVPSAPFAATNSEVYPKAGGAVPGAGPAGAEFVDEPGGVAPEEEPDAAVVCCA
ncbi:Uncharacterised protein [Mycobacteroides abscessus subsp. abscessus]|nr:Uncharacterised protein [Mycobacteroides abscessus subsp. abscessus]